MRIHSQSFQDDFCFKAKIKAPKYHCCFVLPLSVISFQKYLPPQEYTMAKGTSSVSGAGKSGQLCAKE